MKVDAREILFFRENEPTAFSRVISESLKSQGLDGLVTNRTFIHTEIRTLKGSYNEIVINEARRLLKAIKGVEYKPELVTE